MMGWTSSLIDPTVEGCDPIGKRPIEFGPWEMKECRRRRGRVVKDELIRGWTEVTLSLGDDTGGVDQSVSAHTKR